MLLFRFDYFILLAFVCFLRLLDPFCLILHGDQSRCHSGEQSCHEDVWIGEHCGIQHFLRPFHKEQPIIMQCLCRSCPSFHCHHSHNRRAIYTVCSHETEQDSSEPLVVFNHVGNTAQSLVYDTLGLLTNFVEHHEHGILDVGDLTCDGLGLLLHQTAEFPTLVSKALDDLLNLRESDLSGFHKFLDLAFCHTELFGEFANHRNATSGELIKVLGV